jgi:predicted DNA-binding protein
MVLVTTPQAPLTIKRTVRFYADTSDKLDKLAAEHGCRPSDLVRDAVEAFVDPFRFAAIVAERLAQAEQHEEAS